MTSHRYFDGVFDAEEIAAGIARWAGIESPSYEPEAVNLMMDEASQALSSLGASIIRHPGEHGFGDVVIARLSPSNRQGSAGAEHGSPIMILGHLDTVHDLGTTTSSLPVRREDDKLYGPGVQDMKGGVFLAVHAVSKLIELRGNLRAPITFMLIPDEEVGSPSTRALIEHEARKCRCVLVPEPAHGHKLVTGRHAFLRYRLRTFGQPAHAGVARGVGRSAIAVMAKLIGEIEGFSDIDREVTYRVGVVQGGRFVNVIATECFSEVLCVAPNAAAFEEIRARMETLKSPDPAVRLEVEPGPVRPLFQAPPGTLELLQVAQGVGKAIGLELGHGQFGGGSDGNFTGALGIPTLDGLGVVGAGLHTKNEHILVAELVPRARLLTGVIEALSERNH